MATAQQSKPDGEAVDMSARTSTSSALLYLQHFLFKDSLGFLLHPDVHVRRDAAIADVGTGTAMWAIELSRLCPDAKINGLDADLVHAPDQRFLPANVALRRWDVFEEPPAELVGKYDVVHVRRLVVRIQDGEPGPVLARLLKLLKPGGYLQWDELNTADISIKRADPDMKTPALDRLEKMFHFDGRMDWPLHLARAMRAAGFETATTGRYADKPGTQRAFHEQHLMAMEEYAVGLQKDGKQEAADECFDAIKQARVESMQGAGISIPRLVCLARMPQ